MEFEDVIAIGIYKHFLKKQGADIPRMAKHALVPTKAALMLLQSGRMEPN